MQNKQPFLSIVIPAYNEVDNLRRNVLNKVEAYLKTRPYTTEVIVVDDGSTDATPDLVNNWIKGRPAWYLVRNPHKGKAPTVAKGVLQASGRYILFTDFDQATPIAEIEKLMPFMEKGFKIAIGSREVKGSRREQEPWYRHLMGRVWNTLVQTLAIPGIRDTQCGFKLFEGKVAKELFQSLRVYANAKEREAYTGAFDVELLYIAQKRGLPIAEVPINWTHIPSSRVNPVRDSLRMTIDLLKIRLADLQGRYDHIK